MPPRLRWRIRQMLLPGWNDLQHMVNGAPFAIYGHLPHEWCRSHQIYSPDGRDERIQLGRCGFAHSDAVGNWTRPVVVWHITRSELIQTAPHALYMLIFSYNYARITIWTWRERSNNENWWLSNTGQRQMVDVVGFYYYHPVADTWTRNQLIIRKCIWCLMMMHTNSHRAIT